MSYLKTEVDFDPHPYFSRQDMEMAREIDPGPEDIPVEVEARLSLEKAKDAELVRRVAFARIEAKRRAVYVNELCERGAAAMRADPTTANLNRDAFPRECSRRCKLGHLISNQALKVGCRLQEWLRYRNLAGNKLVWSDLPDWITRGVEIGKIRRDYYLYLEREGSNRKPLPFTRSERTSAAGRTYGKWFFGSVPRNQESLALNMLVPGDRECLVWAKLVVREANYDKR